MSAHDKGGFVSRAGIKLAAALDAFGLDVRGLCCADLGCQVGGFTDCLLARGAASVYAVDVSYGQLAWSLRQDRRVVVMERTNALYLDPWKQANFAGCDLVTIDLGWTRQKLAVPAALRWCRSDRPARIVTLIKPHYEAAATRQHRGVLAAVEALEVAEQVLATMPQAGASVLKQMRSPILGGGRNRKGNTEYLALLAPMRRPTSST